MSTRQFLPKALRQCRSSIAQPRQQPQLKLQQNISTTASKDAGLRQVRQAPNASAQLMDLGAGDNTADRMQPNRTLMDIIAESKERGGSGVRQPADSEADLAARQTTDQYLGQMPRFWREGSIYAPRDLGVGEAVRWSHRGQYKSRVKDRIEALGINPLDNYRNFTFVSEHMTSVGRILPSDRTNLKPVNQRKMAKTIRRAIGLGIHPSAHFHPELLKIKARHRSLPQVVVPKDKRMAAAAAADSTASIFGY